MAVNAQTLRDSPNRALLFRKGSKLEVRFGVTSSTKRAAKEFSTLTINKRQTEKYSPKKQTD